MSISRAQAKALADGFIDQFGRQPPSDKMSVIDAMLAYAAQDFIETAQANLDNTDAVDTGILQRDLRFEVETSGAVHLMSVGYERGSKAAGYWDYVNKGVQGVNQSGKAPGSPYKFRFLGVSKKHAYAIEQWVKQNGMSATNIKRRPVSHLESKRLKAKDAVEQRPSLVLAYAMAAAAKRNGLRATRYFDNAVKDVLGPSFIEALEVALGGEVIISIRQAQIK